jgi:hypothetical protein
MAIFFRGAGVGTYWHQRDPRINGFTAQAPQLDASPERLMGHIVYGTVNSPFVSLTRSFAVARSYALFGETPATAENPGVVWEIEIPDPPPPQLELVDPVCAVARHLPPPLAQFSYQHDGPPTVLLGLVDAKQKHLLFEPCHAVPAGNNQQRPPTLTVHLNALVYALRDAEILATGCIPAACVRFRHLVY